MAKSNAATGPTEPSQPLVISLVFFVLTTIGLGVFCYVLYSDQKGKDEAVAKAAGDVKTARAEAKDWENIAKVNRVFIGTAAPADRDAVLSEIKDGDKAFTELRELNDKAKALALSSGTAAAAKADPKGPKGDPKSVGAEDFAGIWPAASPLAPPAGSLIELAAKSRVERDLALKQAAADRAGYAAAVKAMEDVSAEYKKARDEFKDQSEKLPKTFQARIDQFQAEVDKRIDQFKQTEGQFRSEIETVTKEKMLLSDEKRKLEKDQAKVQNDLKVLSTRFQAPDQFQADQPQGRVLRRLPDGTVEIDLGSAARVQQGLVFSILPADFPEKGRQSRMKVYREPDNRGRYHNVERFTPKGTLEVTEVVGPNLSRARLTGEADDIRDRVLAGDLLYNAVWRKGDVDHVALVGIFDINGDGTDDVQAVVRDLGKMGIPVDAVFDLRTLKWKGQLTNRTRYLVEGYTPSATSSDPNQPAKTKIVGAMGSAKDEARNKAIAVVKLQDFFGRIGYRIAPGVTDDRINQAATPYLGGVGTIEAPKTEGN